MLPMLQSHHSFRDLAEVRRREGYSFEGFVRLLFTVHVRRPDSTERYKGVILAAPGCMDFFYAEA